MIDAARTANEHARSRKVLVSGIFAAILLLAAGCVSNDADPDGQPDSPSPVPSIVVTSLPGTVTEAAPAPSATSFTRPTSVINPTSSAVEVPPAVDAVIARAVEEYGVSASDVSIINYEQQTWPSTALGCPEPGRSYAQIVIRGFDVVLNVNGTAVTYHADETGAAIVRCDLSPNVGP